MLVYCSTIWLTTPTNIDDVRRVVARWIGKKTGAFVEPTNIARNGRFTLRDGSQAYVVQTDDNSPLFGALRYTHRDSIVAGRQWITEIGVRQEDTNSDIECSILLKTSEASTRVSTPIQATRPIVVHNLLTLCTPSERTCGITVKKLSVNNAESIQYLIDNPDRHYPIVIISPTQDGEYFVSIDRLHFLLSGLAEIHQIPIGADTFTIEYMMGSEYAAWRGAVNIIFPRSRRDRTNRIQTKRFLAEEITELNENAQFIEQEIFSLITHRMNIPNSWRHITPDMVSEFRLRRELSKRREEATATGDTSEYIALLEETNTDHEQRITRLQEDVRGYEDLLIQLEEDHRQLKYENEALKLSFSEAMRRATNSTSGDIPEELQAGIFSVINQEPSIVESLKLVSVLFPNRITVLDSAWKSAEDAEAFRERRRALVLLWKLVTSYWEALNSGLGDNEARQIFGSSFASKESETVENNERARKLRTFQYEGDNIEMMSHLKIGVKPSVVETLRIHFMWDSTARRIVIGHCGGHLDHR